jgi:hypothetical protein
MTYALVSAKDRFMSIHHFLNGFISPLLKETFNFHAALDGPQRGSVKIKP